MGVNHAGNAKASAWPMVWLLFCLFFVGLFLVYDVNFHGADEPIYFAYTASLVDDGDLNAVNHLDEHYPYYLPSGKIGVSRTYNLPDFHNHGGVILWAPFYLYAKFAYAVGRALKIESLTVQGAEALLRCVMSFSTVVFAVFCLLFTFFLCRIFVSGPVALWAMLALFFGTPFYFFSTYEIGNANIIASLFSVLSIWFLSHLKDGSRLRWFFYGLFFSISIIVKSELFFQIVFVYFIQCFIKFFVTS